MVRNQRVGGRVHMQQRSVSIESEGEGMAGRGDGGGVPGVSALTPTIVSSPAQRNEAWGRLLPSAPNSPVGQTAPSMSEGERHEGEEKGRRGREQEGKRRAGKQRQGSWGGAAVGMLLSGSGKRQWRSRSTATGDSSEAEVQEQQRGSQGAASGSMAKSTRSPSSASSSLSSSHKHLPHPFIPHSRSLPPPSHMLSPRGSSAGAGEGGRAWRGGREEGGVAATSPLPSPPAAPAEAAEAASAGAFLSAGEDPPEGLVRHSTQPPPSQHTRHSNKRTPSSCAAPVLAAHRSVSCLFGRPQTQSPPATPPSMEGGGRGGGKGARLQGRRQQWLGACRMPEWWPAAAAAAIVAAQLPLALHHQLAKQLRDERRGVRVMVTAGVAVAVAGGSQAQQSFPPLL